MSVETPKNKVVSDKQMELPLVFLDEGIDDTQSVVDEDTQAAPPLRAATDFPDPADPKYRGSQAARTASKYD
jgi:hypothetical protein